MRGTPGKRSAVRRSPTPPRRKLDPKGCVCRNEHAQGRRDRGEDRSEGRGSLPVARSDITDRPPEDALRNGITACPIARSSHRVSWKAPIAKGRDRLMPTRLRRGRAPSATWSTAVGSGRSADDLVRLPITGLSASARRHSTNAFRPARSAVQPASVAAGYRLLVEVEVCSASRLPRARRHTASRGHLVRGSVHAASPRRHRRRRRPPADVECAVLVRMKGGRELSPHALARLDSCPRTRASAFSRTRSNSVLSPAEKVRNRSSSKSPCVSGLTSRPDRRFR